ncbi:hypothetical protein [Serratia sp. UGAL515B_01]|nr:hypothetical protein [Serratia sp. UGAL515B_01]WON78523.1 hypothetical protein OK023_07795 [Serratia sp. UGAL515B_01]
MQNVIVQIDKGGQYSKADYQAMLKRRSLGGSYEYEMQSLHQRLH